MLTIRYRTMHASGAIDQGFETKLGAAHRWNDSGFAFYVEELVFGVWEEVPTCELAHALRVARMRQAGIEPQFLAESAGRIADAAYEDTIYLCTEGK